jgi:hypothetical protein
MRSPLDRRTFLRGAGVAIALPMLEAMTPLCRAAAPKKPIKRFISYSNNYGIYAKGFFPSADQPGADYDMPSTLKPLERHRRDFSVFSNLDHGIGGGHAAVPTLLNGVRPFLSANFPDGNISLDQKIAEFVGAQTRFPSMTLHVRDQNLVSITRTGVQVPSIDLRAMYRALFLEESSAAKKLQAQRFKLNTSILDVVLNDAKRVNKTLGKQDQHKFEEYLESVRGLEKKIVQQEPWLERPKPSTKMKEPQPTGRTPHDVKTMMELIALAVQTDSSRAITLTSGFASGDHGIEGGYHGFSHHGEREKETAALKQIDASMMANIAHLIDLLKAQEDPINGGTLFDHTSILFGCGMATGTHSTKNLPLILAGGGFKLGNHVICPEEKGKRWKAANLLLSILQSHGVEVDQFGTSSGTLTGLEWKA